jgi:hypothetical protein
MKLPRRKFLRLAAGAAALPALSRTALSQSYPARPVRWVGGFAAGGAPGHCAAPVAIDRNSWSRSIGMSGRDCRNAQLFSGIGFHQELRPVRCVKICRY